MSAERTDRSGEEGAPVCAVGQADDGTLRTCCSTHKATMCAHHYARSHFVMTMPEYAREHACDVTSPPWNVQEAPGGALLSADGRYRYQLTRHWRGDGPDDVLGGLQVCWVMLNPSTADATEDDPTIRRCIAFSKAWGFGSLVVVNLWALRSTDPKALFTADDPNGPDNDEAIHLAMAGSHAVVLAWGASGARMPSYEDRRAHVMACAKTELNDVHALGFTKDGHPRHPLYVKGDTPRSEVWRVPDELAISGRSTEEVPRG